ncbi:MAG TPA: hypothetical protein VG457_16805, partial [Planctomycetota bacterium]|nr:hypothetical protein [Planctomycetota bacterium]
MIEGRTMPSRRLSRLATLSGAGLFLAMGVTTGLLIGARRTTPGSEAPHHETRFDTGDASRTSTLGLPTPALAPGLPEKPALSPSSPLALKDGLGRIRTIFAEWLSRYPRAPSICAHQCFQELGESWDKIRQSALNDPSTYFAFLRAPGNEDACGGLLFLLYPHPLRPIFDEELPVPILQGVADLMAS